MSNNYNFIRTLHPLGKVVYLRLLYYFCQHIVYLLLYDFTFRTNGKVPIIHNNWKGKSTKKFMIYNNMRTEPFSERRR